MKQRTGINMLSVVLVSINIIVNSQVVSAEKPAAPPMTNVVVQEETFFEETLNKVKEFIAQYFSRPIEEITLDTHLFDDLKAGHMDAFEAVAMLCDQEGVNVPSTEKDFPKTIREIVKYLDNAEEYTPGKTQHITITPRGGDGKMITRGGNVKIIELVERIHTQKVFFATNRKPTGRKEPNDYFGRQRSDMNGVMKYGFCEVTIPAKAHEKGELEEGDDPRQHIVIKYLKELAWNAFADDLNQFVTRSGLDIDLSNDVLVFIHGYNVPFDRAVRRTAQIAYDYGFTGAPVLFSWPSDGGTFRYFSDRVDAEWSALYFERFIQDLAKKSKARRLHLIAHSMGNQVLLRALNRIVLQQGQVTNPLFDNVIMAAPDFDTRLFTEQIAASVRSLSKHWTIYTSELDKALELSAEFSAAKRLGKPVSVATGFDTVDVLDSDVTPWRLPKLFHSYFVNKPRVIDDLIAVLKNVRPENRNLELLKSGEVQYWQIK